MNPTSTNAKTPIAPAAGPSAPLPGVKSAARHVSGADGFRAIACLGVFVHHLFGFHANELASQSGWKKLLMAGSNGVGAFFVLSGFLLSIPYWKAHRAKYAIPDLRIYVMRRLGRILPGYLLCFLVLWLLTRQFAADGGLFQLATSLTFTNPFFPSTYYPPFDLPLWSISIEMLFYAMLPIVAMGMFRLRTANAVRVYAVAIIAGIICFQLLLLRVSPRLDEIIQNKKVFAADAQSVTGNALLLFTHFLIGFLAVDALLFLEWRRDNSPAKPRSTVWNMFDSVAIGILLVIPILLSGADQHIPLFWNVWYLRAGPYHWPLLHLMFGALLVCLALSQSVGRWLDTRILRVTATLSFGIYIWHVPVLRGVARIWPTPVGNDWPSALVFGFVALAATYAVAAVSYYTVELPVLNAINRRSKSRPPEVTSSATQAALSLLPHQDKPEKTLHRGG